MRPAPANGTHGSERTRRRTSCNERVCEEEIVGRGGGESSHAPLPALKVQYIEAQNPAAATKGLSGRRRGASNICHAHRPKCRHDSGTRASVYVLGLTRSLNFRKGGPSFPSSPPCHLWLEGLSWSTSRDFHIRLSKPKCGRSSAAGDLVLLSALDVGLPRPSCRFSWTSRSAAACSIASLPSVQKILTPRSTEPDFCDENSAAELP